MIGVASQRLSPYWVSRGLVLVVAGDQWITPNGSLTLPSTNGPRRITTPLGVATGFGSTDAGNTNARYNAPSLPNSRRGPRSYFGTVFARSTGGGGLGRLWQDATGAGGATIGEEAVYFVSGRLTLTKVGNATGSLQLGANTLTPLGSWSSFGFSCNFVPGATMSASDVVSYQNGARDTNFVNNASTQNYPDGFGCSMSIGNRPSDSARTWDGQIGYIAVFDAILTDAEQAALHKNPRSLVESPARNGWFFQVPAGAGSQTLSPPLLANAQTFYAHSISQAGGTQTLSPSLFTNSQAFYSPTVGLGAVTLSPGLFSNAQTFYAHTLSQAGGPQTLSPSLYTNSQTFYGGSVGVGTVTLSPSLFTNSATFYSATVSQGAPAQTLSPSLLTNAQAFYGPTATVGAVTLLPGLFTNAQTFYSASLSGGIPLLRQKGLRKTRYTPGRVPAQQSELVRFLQSELERLNDALESPFTHQLLEVLSVEPARKREGMVALADGSSWNPGSGKGVYVYYSGTWNRLG